ncbi:hypothetical protein QA600_18450 [Natronococcus sp. A-GB1]|uniref:hypothetical protein n=1 Tax=Natronococcus sp. A-GB1 TaxID=3037648 RepID=UPI00241E77D8|nr:hypothetical protein [Natronococcus sp. A-GB1]MDG5761314.1 hypothetical protein [Natronococcus sp. A-GB1]
MDIEPQEEVKVTIEFSEEPEELPLREFSDFITSLRYLDEVLHRSEVEQAYRDILYEYQDSERLYDRRARDQFIGRLTQEGVFKRARRFERSSPYIRYPDNNDKRLRITRIQKESPLAIEFVGVAFAAIAVAWLTASIEYDSEVVEMKTEEGVEYEKRRRHIKFEPKSFSDAVEGLMKLF